jgi:hypothetical protein
MSTFTIDFFELSFLAEACIPPRPIARAMFWHNLTDIYWEKMTENERSRLYEWLNRNSHYQESLAEEEDTQVFDARFNPDNQYMVSYHKGEFKGAIRAFLREGRYWLGTTKFIPTEHITNVEKLKPTEDDPK